MLGWEEGHTFSGGDFVAVDGGGGGLGVGCWVGGARGEAGDGCGGGGCAGVGEGVAVECVGGGL